MHLSWGLERRRKREGGEEAPARNPRRPRRDRQPTASDEAVVHKASRNPQRPRRRRQERHRAAAEEEVVVVHAYACAASRCPPGLAYSASCWWQRGSGRPACRPDLVVSNPTSRDCGCRSAGGSSAVQILGRGASGRSCGRRRRAGKGVSRGGV